MWSWRIKKSLTGPSYIFRESRVQGQIMLRDLSDRRQRITLLSLKHYLTTQLINIINLCNVLM